MLERLRQMTQEISASSSLEEALQRVVERLNDALQSDACSIFLCDDVQGEYVLMATMGLNAEQVGKARIKFGAGLVGLVGEREELINIENAASSPHFLRYPTIEEEAYSGFLGAPIIERGELLGVLVVQQHEQRCFAEEEAAFCMTLAVQLAPDVACARARGAMQVLNTPRRRKKSQEMVLTGLSGASGVAMGSAMVVYPPADLEAVPEQAAVDQAAECEAFERALNTVREDIHVLSVRAKQSLTVSESLLFDAYLQLLDSRSFIEKVLGEIKGGQWAQGALKRVIKQHVAQFEALEDPYLRERAADFRDLGRRILAHLQLNEQEALDYPQKTILMSDELTATALLEVPEGQLVAAVSGSGSSNSHVAILARALGIPTVMGVTGASLSALSGKACIVDGYSGHLYVAPSLLLKKEFRMLAAEEEELDRSLQSLRDLPAETKDQHRIALYVNTGLAVEGGFSLSVGAEGIGLYRTEMPFMVRDRFPTEEEQRIMYRQLLSTFAPRPVAMRTLDIGGDKSLPYFAVEEENPFLGWRGIRVTLDHPEIFLQQVRGMLRANEGLNNLSILLPMVMSVAEVEASIRLITQAHEELLEEGLVLQMPLIGSMIEVPAAVYQARDIAKRVDFLSVGSNDLIQYVLALDRNNPRVAHLYDGLHPAVLHALQKIVTAAHQVNKPVSICGELASDPLAVVLLLGMGFDSFSMNARSLPRVKWVLRAFTVEAAKALLDEVKKMDDPKEVRGHMEIALEEAGLGGLIRAGR